MRPVLLLVLLLPADTSSRARRAMPIVYTRHQESAAHELWALDPDTGRETPLQVPSPNSSWPCVSPDGRRVTFVMQSDAGHGLYVIGTDGKNLVRIDSVGNSGWRARWSPDGARLAYPAGAGGIRIVTADGKTRRDVAVAGSCEHLEWSPTEDAIVYCDGSKLYYLNFGRAAPEEILAADPYSVSFSPDGRRLAYARAGGVAILDIAARNETMILRDIREAATVSFSPDGRRIAYYSYEDGNCEVYCVDDDGRNRVRLTDSPTYDEQPKWSPDGRWILFASNRDGDYDLFRIRPDGTGLQRLTDHDGTDYLYDW